MAEILAPLSFDCPRCGAAVAEPFYGPCRTCVADLRGAGLEAGTAAAAEYAPKMNVTPNFIATKD